MKADEPSVNYPRLKFVGSPLPKTGSRHSLQSRCIGAITQTQTHEPVDGDSSGVNLELLVRKPEPKPVPQHQSFDGYGHSQTRLSVGVYNLAAFSASEQGTDASIIFVPDNTAVGTPLACMAGILLAQHHRRL
ncbi:MAG: hypothetical protein QW767_07120 [Thermoprotei archaeon]